MINTNWFDQAKKKIDNSVIDTVPFDHIVIDDFLPIDDQPDFYQKLTNIKSRQATQIYDNKNNGSKLQFNQDIGDPALSSLMQVFGSAGLATLIKDKFNLDQDLYPDTTFEGGGLTFSPPTTFLRYHGDFNFSSNANRYRIVNAIFYLNHDYHPSNGGHLHLIDPESNTVERVVKPYFNRVVIFKTNRLTPHGVNRNSPGFTRASFNCYFYGDRPLLEDEIQPHRTLWAG